MEGNSYELSCEEFWETKARGTLEDEYDIYKSCAEDLGWDVKTYEEWLAS